MRFAIALLVGCGRVGFDAREAPFDSDSPIDQPAASVHHAQIFAERHPGPGGADSFTAQALAAGDLVVVQLGCGDATGQPTAAGIAATGWTFLPLSGIVTTSSAKFFARAFSARAPDTAPATLTATWSGVDCDVGTSVLADEFGGAQVAVDDTISVANTTLCHAELTVSTTGDAAWFACFSSVAVAALDPRYTAGANNGGGDQAAYRIPAAPAGQLEDPTFDNTVENISTLVLLKP